MFVARGEWYSTKKSRIQIRHFVVLGFDNVLVPFLNENSINSLLIPYWYWFIKDDIMKI